MDINDYQNCVNEMRRCLATGTINESVVEETNNQFAEAIREVNSRLRECEKMLRQHQVIEAIRQADLEPSLLESFEILDIAEIDQWNSLLQSFDLDVGEPLCHGPAEDLNASYAELQPLEEDLRRHRLLAIAQSPLRLRLKTLRKLNLLDPDNRIWSEDLEAFESERKKQIQAELQNAIQQQDISKIENLITEIRQTDWIAPPPAKWISAAAGATAKIKRKLAYKRLNAVTRDLENAWQEQAFPDPAVEIGEQWYELQEACELADDDPLMIRAEPALDWLEEQTDSARLEQAALNAIERIDAILTKAEGAKKLTQKKQARIEIQKLLAQVDRSEQEIPAILRSRISNFHNNLEKTSRQKFTLRLAAVAAAVVVGLAGALWLMRSLDADARITELVDSIRQPFVERQWADAKRAWSTVPEGVRALPSVQEMKKEIDRQLKRKDQKEQEEKVLVANARQRFDAARKAFEDAENDTSPASISVRKTARGQLEDTRQFLSSLVSENKSESNQKIKSMLGQVNDYITRNNEFIDQQLFDLLDSLRSKYQDISKKDTDTSKQVRGYQSLLEEMRSAKNVYQGLASSDLIESMGPLENKINGHLKKLDEYREYRDAIQNLDSRLFSSSAYRKELQKVISDYPDYAQELQIIIDHDLPAWATIDAHNQIIEQVGDFRSQGSRGENTDKIYALLQKIRVFRNNHPGFDAQELQGAEDHLVAISARPDLHDEVVSKLSKKIFKEGKVVKIEGKGAYFVTGLSKLSSGGYKARVLRNADGKIANQLLEIEDSENLDQKPITADEAQHCKLTFEILQYLQNIESDAMDWEASVWKLVQAVYKNQQANKIIKHIFLIDILRLGEKGSVSFNAVMKTVPPELRSLADYNAATDFFDERKLDTAGEKLKKLKKILASGFKEEKKIRANNNSGSARYEAIGLIYENGAQALDILTSAKKLEFSGRLYVPSGSDSALISIGDVEDGDFQLDFDPSNSRYLIVGRPVFVKLSPEK